MEPLPIAQLFEIEEQKKFIFGGNAYFTIENPDTGNRFTYRISKAIKTEEEDLFWVSLLRGPDNTSDYSFMGLIKGGEYRHSKKKMSEDSKAAVAFRWWYGHLIKGSIPTKINFYHCGRCCVCGRLLTTPESVKAGIGPKCASGGGY